MSSTTLYYNPKCGTCRKVLEALKKKKIEPRLVEYLKTPPTAAELAAIARACGGAHAIVRVKEDEYAAESLSDSSSEKDVLRAIAKHPILLQRPIVIMGKRGVVARPPEKLEDLF